MNNSNGSLDQILVNDHEVHTKSCNCRKCQDREISLTLDNYEFDHGIIFDPYERKDKLKKDRRKKIISTHKVPFRYICRITLKDGTFLGTGTLIGPRTVLTAAHVVWRFTTDSRRGHRDFIITPAQKGAGTDPFRARTQSTRVIPASGYNNAYAVSSRDYAVIHLKHRIGNKIGYWGIDDVKWPHDKTGTSMVKRGLPLGAGNLKVNLSGYPNDKHRGNFQYWSYNYTSRKTNLQSDGMLQYFNDTFAGHSGSPVWVRRHASMGGRVMVGIHVGIRTATSSKPNKAVYLSSSVVDFIRDNTV